MTGHRSADSFVREFQFREQRVAQSRLPALRNASLPVKGAGFNITSQDRA